MALRLTKNPADAEDLVQDATLLAFRGFDTFQQGTNFGAWFLRVLTNAFLSGRRKARPLDEAVSLDQLPNAYMQRQARRLVPDGSAQPWLAAGDIMRSVLGRLEVEAVASAIDSLPDEFRAAAALYFLDDLSYQEIAGVLEVPVGTVRSRLHRGRALLQMRLWEIALDHGLARSRGEDA